MFEFLFQQKFICNLNYLYCTKMLFVEKQRIVLKDEAHVTYTDYSIYKSESEKAVPTIQYAYEGNIYSNCEVGINDLFRAKDYQDKDLRVKVLRIKNQEGTDVTDLYNMQTENIIFPEQGVYKFTVTTTDTSKKKYTCAISVPVTKGN